MEAMWMPPEHGFLTQSRHNGEAMQIAGGIPSRMAAIRKMNGLQSTAHGTISAKTAGCWIKAGTGLTENVTICTPAELWQRAHG